jgi:predicted AlkP superfamily phosphohydrolase/phosphomutase
MNENVKNIPTHETNSAYEDNITELVKNIDDWILELEKALKSKINAHEKYVIKIMQEDTRCNRDLYVKRHKEVTYLSINKNIKLFQSKIFNSVHSKNLKDTAVQSFQQ